MNSEISRLFLIEEGLSPDGYLYITDRSLSVPIARKCGICTIADDIVFAYRLHNEIVRLKYRNMKDKKKIRFNTFEEDAKPDFKMPFYNQIEWPLKDFLIITEGEFDCIALMQLIGRNVVSLPNGAGSLESTFKNQYNYIQDYQTIYVCTDMDEAGNEAAKKALTLLSPIKYRRMILPYKDANEWLIKEPYLEKCDVEQVMRDAQKVQSKSFTKLCDLRDFYDQVDPGVSTGWKQLDKMIGGLREGEVTVVSADTGSGKSTFCINMLFNIALQGFGFWLNSYEMDHKIVMRKISSMFLRKNVRLQAFNDIDKFKFEEWKKNLNCYINTSTCPVNLQELRKDFELASYVYGIKYILIDHLDYIHASGEKKNQYENIDEAVREIHSLAMEFGVSVILVVHPKQIEHGKEVSMAHFKGSSGIKQYADNIVVLTRMDRIDPLDINRVKIRVWKNRLCGTEGQFFLRYCENSETFEEGLENVF